MTTLNETLTALLDTHSASDINNELYNIQQRINRIAELTAQRDSITAELNTLTGTQHTTATETVAELTGAIELEQRELSRLVSISSGRARGMTLGIEIEFIAPVRMSTFRDWVQSQLNSDDGNTIRISNQTGGLHNNTATMWQIARDSSIHAGAGYGMELISPILKGEKGLMQAVAIMDAIEHCGAYVNRSCGVHVHFGVERMEYASVLRIIETYALNQELIKKTLPASRRNQHFIRDLPINANDRNGFDTYGASLARFQEFASGNFSTQEVVANMGGSASYHDSRYFAVNLLGAYTRHKTIEFRALAGTVESEKLETWVRFLHLIVKSAETNRDTNRAYDNITEMCATLADKTDLNLEHATRNPTTDWAQMVTAIKTGTDNSNTQNPYRSRAKAQLAGKAIGEWLQQRAYTING